MITPTIGRIVWFWPHDNDLIPQHDDNQSLAAIVTYVWHDRLVNLAVFDANGATSARTSVPLLQDNDAEPAAGFFAQWMPYQQGQAANAEAADARASGSIPQKESAAG